MPDYPVLPLKAQQSIEVTKSWEDIKTPQDLINLFIRTVGVDPNQLLKFQEIVSSSLEPSDSDRGKIWLKTSNPPGVGVFTGSKYVVVYEYPPNVPLLWTTGSENFPSYLTKIGEDDLTDYGITPPPGDDMFYFMLKV